jgi:hypothetical protein
MLRVVVIEACAAGGPAASMHAKLSVTAEGKAAPAVAWCALAWRWAVNCLMLAVADICCG